MTFLLDSQTLGKLKQDDKYENYKKHRLLPSQNYT